MRYRKLTADGDYSFGNGQSDFWRDVPEAVGQACKTRLLLWLGEWFLNTSEGTPYLQGILGKHPGLKETADITIQDRVRGTQGFANIKNYVSVIEPNTRQMTVSFDLDTIYGPTAVDLENYRNY